MKLWLRELRSTNKNTEKFAPGDVIWIPIAELKPELRKEDVIEFKIPKITPMIRSLSLDQF